MSKGVFVIDMHDNCYDCPLRVYVDCYIVYVCQDITNWDFDETDNDVFEIISKCPLRPIPKIPPYLQFGEYVGYEMCLKEIVGGDEDGSKKN